jgi:hypothetical protein
MIHTTSVKNSQCEMTKMQIPLELHGSKFL